MLKVREKQVIPHQLLPFNIVLRTQNKTKNKLFWINVLSMNATDCILGYFPERHQDMHNSIEKQGIDHHLIHLTSV